jgi:tripartite-type tricarboxylate transporter receptor subunit TctC
MRAITFSINWKFISTLIIFLIAFASHTLGHSENASSNSYPIQPITLIIPYAPGGSADFLARPLMAELQKKLGQPIVIDYKAGAGGTIATAALAKSKADGYTLLMVLSAHAINPSLYPNLPYDTKKDFAAVTLLAKLPQLLVVREDSPFKNLSDLINFAKSNPDKLSYGSAGNGNTSHLAGEMLQSQAAIKMVHVPYKGSGPVVVAMLGGEIDLMFDSFSTSYPQVKAGKFRALAIASAKRSALLPNVPSLSETYPNLFMEGWYGILAPVGTPRPVIEKLNSAFNQTLNNTQVKAQLMGSGYDIVGTTPEQYTKTIEDDLLMWSKIVKDSGAKLQ